MRVASRRDARLRAFARNASVATLVSFHALLLWQRCADASILDPVVFAKYAGAALLLIGAALHKRLAFSRSRSRRAVVVFWLIALLLHAVAPFSTASTLDPVAIVELGLSVPLAFAGVAIVAEVARSLRALHGVTVVNALLAPARHHVRIPSRAPPSSR